MKAPDVLVFDMDGVLVEVSESYRESIRETVKHFTGTLPSHDTIQNFKNAGGWNNDWLLSHRLIQDAGQAVEYGDVVEQFNRIFLGENGDGLIRRERWLATAGLLENLRQHSALAIFTGRSKYEADVTLERNGVAKYFDLVVTDDSVGHPKPAPDGLNLIQNRYPEKTIWYLGDTVDDARSAQSANVAFIGVSTPHNPRHKEIAGILTGLGAFVVLDDINGLEAIVKQAHEQA